MQWKRKQRQQEREGRGHHFLFNPTNRFAFTLSTTWAPQQRSARHRPGYPVLSSPIRGTLSHPRMRSCVRSVWETRTPGGRGRRRQGRSSTVSSRGDNGGRAACWGAASLSGCCCPRPILWELLQPASLPLSAPPKDSPAQIPDKLRLMVSGGCRGNGRRAQSGPGLTSCQGRCIHRFLFSPWK